MTAIAEDLRTYLLADATISSKTTQCHQNETPEDYTGAYIWFGRASVEPETTLSDNDDVPFRQRFDIEVWSTDVEDPEAVSEAIWAMHGNRGSFGAGTVQGLFIVDHTDGYVHRGHPLIDDNNNVEGLHAADLQIEIVGYVNG